MWSSLCVLGIMILGQRPPDIFRHALNIHSIESTLKPGTHTTTGTERNSDDDMLVPALDSSGPSHTVGHYRRHLAIALGWQVVQFPLLFQIYTNGHIIKHLVASTVDASAGRRLVGVQLSIAHLQILHSLGGCARLYAAVRGESKPQQASLNIASLSFAGLVFLIKVPFLCIWLMYSLCSSLVHYAMRGRDIASQSDRRSPLSSS